MLLYMEFKSTMKQKRRYKVNELPKIKCLKCGNEIEINDHWEYPYHNGIKCKCGVLVCYSST
jgi:hypothetical protein